MAGEVGVIGAKHVHPLWLSIYLEQANNMSVVKKFGRAVVGTSFTPICFGGFYRTPQAASATKLRVKAGNAADTAAGAGAREIIIEGLDDNFALCSDVLATAGESASADTVNTYTRMFRFYVSKSGTYATQSAGSHEANIVIENAAGTEDWGTIDSAQFPLGQSEIGAYTIPAGYTGYVRRDTMTFDTSRDTNMIFFAREGCDQSAPPYDAMRAKSVQIALVDPLLGNDEFPLGPFTGPCDIGFLGKVEANTGQTSVEFEIILVKENG